LFFAEDREGLISGAGHPGCVVLDDTDLQAFKAARDVWMAKPKEERLRIAGWDSDIDWHQRRLDWLVWWTEWALVECRHPTFGNG